MICVLFVLFVYVTFSGVCNDVDASVFQYLTCLFFFVQLAKKESIVVDMSGHETNPFADPNADPFSVSFGELYVAGGV